MNEYVLIDKSELTSIANKVRSIEDSTEPMNVLDIDNKLDNIDTTIKDAVASAIVALTNKGIKVPDGTNVIGLAELIAAIEVGASVEVGSVTFAQATGIYTIPTTDFDIFIIFLAPDSTLLNTSLKHRIWAVIQDDVAKKRYYYASSTSGSYTSYQTPRVVNLKDEYRYEFTNTDNDDMYTAFAPDYTYKWIAVKGAQL